MHGPARMAAEAILGEKLRRHRLAAVAGGPPTKAREAGAGLCDPFLV